MAKKKHESSLMTKVGPWAFIFGLFVAILTASFVRPSPGLLWFLAALGAIVGLMNITDKEIRTYLIATIAFLISSSSLVTVIEGIPVFGATMASYVRPFMTNVVVFIAPGAAIVALKALYAISKD
ncbi:hypothetical protein JW930_06265 [Candidatus Woesearchaeota archaeon]|nr:hypothetical protein [Candidatus Woesearchaeota archaeon]